MVTPELLAPAGNLERLVIAIEYGADAVYIGGSQYGLRAFADNFSREDIIKGIEYAHDRNKRLYVTMNIFARNEDFNNMEYYIRFLNDAGIDAIILSDPGILALVKKLAPDMEIHLSTQANTTNWQSALFWHEQGVKRIILSRELSLGEIKEIKENTPDSLELEAFVHGAMCMSYSGRCLISSFMTGRDANRGACAQPCRWKYYLTEEKRPGEYMPVAEDDRGTYFFNSRDLCMLEHIKELMSSGIVSFKIEGRMKTSYYVATVVQAYRKEIDLFLNNPRDYKFNDIGLQEIKKASHRPFTTGFYFNRPTGEDHEYESSKYIRGYDFVGIVLDYDRDRNMMLVEQRNPFSIGDDLEIMRPGSDFINFTVEKMYDESGETISNAPHPQQKIYIPVEMEVTQYSILRKQKE